MRGERGEFLFFLCSPVLAVPEQCGCGGRARRLPKTQVQEEAEGLVGRYSCAVTALVPRPWGAALETSILHGGSVSLRMAGCRQIICLALWSIYSLHSM